MKVYLDSVGCRLNQSEIESYARQLRTAGHTLVGQMSQADLVVVNTCAVTAAAAADSRQKIRQASRQGAAQVAVTGCWSTLFPVQAAALPGVVQVTPNQEKDHLVAQVLDLPADYFDRQLLDREPVPGLRMRTRAFIKAQDGCDNHCTFCLTRLARGPGRSRTTEAVCQDVRAALHGGAQEIVLTGVHLGSWGQDFNPPSSLSELVRTILVTTDVPRLRLSSLEPWDLDESFFGLWQDPRLCRHLHLPLQSGSAGTLRRMARKTTPAEFQHLVSAARAAIPHVAITTDILVGFPGESTAEFEESLDFARDIGFAGGHVFTYSDRPGTPAARMEGSVLHAVRKQRNAEMRQVLETSSARYQQGFLGQELDILWESAVSLGPQGWEMSGLSDNYLRVKAATPMALWNRLTAVRLERVQGSVLQGIVQGIPTRGKDGLCVL